MSDAITRAPFGRMPAGEDVAVFTLTNRAGLQARILTYGGIVASLTVPDRDGAFADVVLGFDTLTPYLTAPSVGALIGRFANRIAHGRFALDGTVHTLPINNGPHHLHGGPKGFDRRVWSAAPETSAEGPSLTLGLISPDGDAGYPGTLHVEVRYTLSHDNALIVSYAAETDRASVLNLTQHSYFNLAGEGAGNVLDHELTIAAETFVPVDDTLIPTGEIGAVAGTPFDFRRPVAIGARIDADDEQLRRGGGYDHTFVLDAAGAGVMRTAARVRDPVSGRVLDVRTSEPGVQLYTANALDGALVGKSGRAYGPRAALCLETQHFPDSPNQPSFPSTVLRPGERFESRTEFVFSVA